MNEATRDKTRMYAHKLDHQMNFIFELTDRLSNDISDYGDACERAGGKDGMYVDYLTSSTATKAATKRSILTIRQELLKLSKELG